MRTLLSLLIIALGISANAQTTICYLYDAAGNRTQKSQVCGGFTGEDPNKGGGSETTLERNSEEETTTLEAPGNGRIVPNPVTGQFELWLDADPALRVECELFDSNGKLVMRQKVESPVTTFDLSDSAAGLYYLLMRSEGDQPQIRTWVVVKQ
jgi:hypothetical protein